MNRKIKIAVTAAVAVIVLIIIGVACVPSIVRSIENGYAKKCYKNAFRLLNVLEENLNSDEVNQTWYELIAEGNSVKLLGALKEELGDDSVDVSNYYVKFGNESVSILCKKHPEMQDVTKSIPNNLVTYDVEFEPPQSDIITRIYATGKDLYFQNVGLDRSDPTKLRFSNSDDMSGCRICGRRRKVFESGRIQYSGRKSGFCKNRRKAAENCIYGQSVPEQSYDYV